MPYSPTLNDINALDNQLAQTNAAGYIPTLADIQALDAQIANTQNSNSLKLQPFSLANTGINAINALGAGGADVLAGLAKTGMGIANTPFNVANLISHYFPNVVSPQTAARIPRSPITGADIDQVFGTQNRGTLGNLLEGAAQYAPYALGGEGLGVGNIGQGAAYGFTQSQNPLTGGIKGATTNAALGLIPWGIGKVAGGINYLKPGDYADQIVSQLSGGRSLEDNAKSLAQDVKNAFAQRTAEGSAQYQPVFNAAGNDSMYAGLQPANSAYQSLDKDVINSYDRNLSKLHQQFINDPTLQNAHNLQSQLGSTIRQLGSKNLTIADQSTLQGYQEAQNALLSDMTNFLNARNPALADQYNAATQNWAENVAPYYEHPKINAMARGDLTNPASIASIFKNPEPEVEKVIEDLGDSARNKIIYSVLGKTNATKSPEGLVNAFENLDQQGLRSYVPQSLAQQIASLSSRIKARNAAQMGVGALAGVGAAKLLGGFISPGMMEPMAAAGGAMLGKGIGGALQKIMPNVQFSNALAQALQKVFPAVPAEVIPNVVGGQ